MSRRISTPQSHPSTPQFNSSTPQFHSSTPQSYSSTEPPNAATINERRPSKVLVPKRPDMKRPRTIYNFGSLLLENKGTVARDHLASERTFLAWLRTSISLASIGIGLTQLLKIGEDEPGTSKLIKAGKVMGMCFVAVATVILGIGGFRYFAIQEMLTDGKFPASVAGVIFVVTIATILSIATLVIVIRL